MKKDTYVRKKERKIFMHNRVGSRYAYTEGSRMVHMRHCGTGIPIKIV